QVSRRVPTSLPPHLHLHPLQHPVHPQHLQAGLPPRLRPRHLSRLPQPPRHQRPPQDLWRAQHYRRGPHAREGPARQEGHPRRGR
ncbi:hypothetical protein BN1723_020952, partial [Verticillium longisporum]